MGRLFYKALQGTVFYYKYVYLDIDQRGKTEKKIILLKYEDCALIPSLLCHTFLNYVLMPNYWS